MRRLLHCSDPHFGAYDSAVAEAFLAWAGESAPDLTVLSGDLTMRARRDELAGARDFVARLPEPRLVIPGNHDMPGAESLAERLLHPYRRYRREIEREIEPVLSAAGCHVVAVNSVRAAGWYLDWSVGRLSRRQLERTVRRFREAPAEALRVLVLHHPVVELQLPGREVVQPLEDLMRTLGEARVDLVLCGHFHRSQVVETGLTAEWRTVISQASTVCSTRLQGEPQGFHEIHHGDGRMEIQQYQWQDGAFESAARWAFERGENGWLAAAG